MEAIGYLFGMTGMFFAIIAWGQIAALRSEFERIKPILEQKDSNRCTSNVRQS